ncbi:recombinase family protein [Kitasatospora camelliae]|uniref:Recombinase family protein n=1 Tax=Kitasatospora camelliae TaxID=3156397 RepID=A0AAU8K2X6_9ACTN
MYPTHPSQAGAGSAALYLRCYPYDHWGMTAHLHALEDHAARLGFSNPRLFLDNGISSRAADRPQLRMLLSRAATGQIDTVIVPGRWTFSLDDPTADAITSFLRSVGTDIIELPGRRRAAA